MNYVKLIDNNIVQQQGTIILFRGSNTKPPSLYIVVKNIAINVSLSTQFFLFFIDVILF